MSDITLSLKHDEALVLFEWLASLEEKELLNMYDEAEQKVLWQIEAQLESILPDILMSDYAARVAAAKGRL
jgi:hypothetical protein